MKVELQPIAELLEEAWALIANAGGGNWETQKHSWVRAAERWRRKHQAWLEDQRAEPRPYVKTKKASTE